MNTKSTEFTTQVLESRNRVLRELAAGAPLDKILLTLAESAESLVPDLRVSILLLDETKRHLVHGAAPSLPDFYLEAINGLEVGPEVGSCGASAFLNERVIVDDVFADDKWTDFRELAERAEFRACWSEPVTDTAGDVLGTFAMYYPDVRRPEPHELKLIETSAQVAGFAIQRKRAEDSLRLSEERFRQLAESINEVFWLTDWDKREVLYVSPAYESIWGKPCQSLIDDPRSWAQPIHPDDSDRVVKRFEERAGTGNFDEEYRIVRPDGTVRWIHDRAFAIFDESGGVYRVAGIATDITERKNTELKLAAARRELDRQVQAKLESLTSDLLLAEERERRRLALDLHDGPNQTIALARIKLTELRNRAPEEMTDGIAEILELIESADIATRTLTFQLSPPVLHDLGFEAAVQWLVEDIQENYGIRISLVDDTRPKPLDERVRVLLFRAVRELLINVAKHAEASMTRILLRRENDRYHILVSDDGVAFDPDSVGVRGLGIHGIRERLDIFGGRMEIRSTPGEGTEVELVAPLLVEE